MAGCLFTHLIFCKYITQEQNHLASNELTFLNTENPYCFLPLCYIYLSPYRLTSRSQQATVCVDSCQNVPFATEVCPHLMWGCLLNSRHQLFIIQSLAGYILYVEQRVINYSYFPLLQNTESLISHLESGQCVK